MDQRFTLAAGGLLAALIALPAPAEAQPNCKPRDEIVKMLADKYKERRRIYGMANPLQMLELFVSASGTWTALISRPNGISCMVASGTDWTEIEPPEPGRPM